MTTKTRIDNLICDNDGTMTSFHFWFAPAILSVVPHLAGVLGVPVEELGLELGRNMIKHRTHETPFPFVGDYFKSKWKGKGTKAQFVRRISEPFFAAIDEHRRRYLHVYPGVRKVIDTAAERGFRLYGLSDAPLEAMIHKFAIAGWHDKFAGIYAMESALPPDEEIWNRADLEFAKSYVKKHLASAARFAGCRFIALPRTHEKPNHGGLEQIIDCFKINRQRAAVVGDSLAKDGGVAQKANIRFLHAAYGSNDHVPRQYLDVIDHLLNPFRGQKFDWHPSSETPPVFTELQRFDHMLPLLKGGMRSKSRITAAA